MGCVTSVRSGLHSLLALPYEVFVLRLDAELVLPALCLRELLLHKWDNVCREGVAVELAIQIILNERCLALQALPCVLSVVF